MQARYKAVIFDFDGTIADTLDAIHLAMVGAFEEAGLQAPDRLRVAHHIGVPLTRIIESLLPEPQRDPTLIGRLERRYRELQRPMLSELLRAFPGARELLDRLAEHDVYLAVASNKAHADLEHHLELLQLKDAFAQVVGGDDHPPEQRKPHPAPLRQILKVAGVQPGEALMVGDTVYDIRMANAAGCDSVAVSFGCHPVEELLKEQPTYLIDSLPELLALVTADSGPAAEPPSNHRPDDGAPGSSAS